MSSLGVFSLLVFHLYVCFYLRMFVSSHVISSYVIASYVYIFVCYRFVCYHRPGDTSDGRADGPVIKRHPSFRRGDCNNAVLRRRGGDERSAEGEQLRVYRPRGRHHGHPQQTRAKRGNTGHPQSPALLGNRFPATRVRTSSFCMLLAPFSCVTCAAAQRIMHGTTQAFSLATLSTAATNVSSVPAPLVAGRELTTRGFTPAIVHKHHERLTVGDV